MRLFYIFLSLLPVLIYVQCRNACPQLKELISPDKQVRIAFDMKNGTPVYSVWYRSLQVIESSELGLILQQPFENGFDIVRILHDEKREQWKPVYGEQDVIPNYYNNMEIELKERGKLERRLNIEFRAYNEGIAFRYIFPEDSIFRHYNIIKELSAFHFVEGAVAYPVYETEQTYSNEPVPFRQVISGVHMPLTIKLKNGFASIFEAYVNNYPNSRLINNNNGSLVTDLLGTAEINGFFTTPWRGILFGENEGSLIENKYLVLNLNPPCAIPNTSWIQAGKMVSNEGNIPLDTKEAKKLVDLIATLGFKYMQLDWAWYGTEVKWTEEEVQYFKTVMPDLPLSWGWHGSERKWSTEQLNGFSKTQPNKFTLQGWEQNTKGDPFTVAKGYVPYGPNVRFKNYYTYVDLNLPELISYAKSKGIGIWLYVEASNTLRQNDLDALFKQYHQWGIVGIKPGFIKYGKQENTNWTRKMVKAAARHQLMVDIHDGRIPDGLTRTYPNLMINEGGGGEEGYHPVVQDVMLPFARCLVGPFDYTPGMYTRGRSYCHMLASLVVYHSPAQTIRRIYAPWHPEGKFSKGGVELDFLKRVPATWSRSHVLAGKIGNYVTVARKNGNSWFIGGMTGDEAYTQKITFDFLESGITYSASLFTDDEANGLNGWCPAKKEIKKLRHGDQLEIAMVEAGGFVMVLDPDQ